MAYEESSKSREIKQMLQSSYTNKYQNEKWNYKPMQLPTHGQWW
jgi:hypothetical protein